MEWIKHIENITEKPKSYNSHFLFYTVYILTDSIAAMCVYLYTMAVFNIATEFRLQMNPIALAKNKWLQASDFDLELWYLALASLRAKALWTLK